VRDRILILNLKVSLDEDEVADDKISDPFEFIRFETVLVLVPGAPVLLSLLTNVLNVSENQTLRHGVGCGIIPQIIDILRLE